MVTTLPSHPPMNTSAALVPELDATLATCLSCHTQDTILASAVAAGADWRCRRCGQRWDAVRLATVAGYDLWLSARGGA